MQLEDPELLLAKKFGREEYCQRMLTSLILGRSYPKWNTPLEPSKKGYLFLMHLFEAAYESTLHSPFMFIDEFELPSDDDNNPGGAPDFAVLLEKTLLWIIELKTEKGSHRQGQLSQYERLSKYHYPEVELKLLYITGTMKNQEGRADITVPLRHFYWSELVPILQDIWIISDNDEEVRLVSALIREIERIDVTPAKYFRDEATVIRNALTLAERVVGTEAQAAINVFPQGLEDLHELRVRIRDTFQRSDNLHNIVPWIWNEKTTDGRALTESGKEVGYELRLSYYK